MVKLKFKVMRGIERNIPGNRNLFSMSVRNIDFQTHYNKNFFQRVTRQGKSATLSLNVLMKTPEH